MAKNKVDIILPVYNALTYVADCIESITKYTHQDKYNLYLINDGSDSKTSEFLKSKAKYHKNISLIVNECNKGFLRSCNIGFQISTSAYVVVINSDVLVVDYWLERLLDCVRSDECIATANPLTNYAANINLPIPSGANYQSMDWVINKESSTNYPDIVTDAGFCMLIRRSALNDLGMLDKIYGRGYFADLDLCMRLTANGYRTVVADNVYVFHKGKVSSKDLGDKKLKNRKIFDERWLGEYNRKLKKLKKLKKDDPLKDIRARLTPKQRWDPHPTLREAYRVIRNKYREKDYIGFISSAIKGTFALPKATTDFVTPEFVESLTRPNVLKVTYVLEKMVVAGGVLSVIQLVNELILLGVEARIVSLYKYPEIDDWKLYTTPIIYKNEKELQKNFPQSDIVVATHWTTAKWIAEIVNNKRAKVSAYFVQDYEGWFFPEHNTQSRQQVSETYKLISNKIVKSNWLRNLLKKDGYESHKILLGMDLSIFYPRDIQESRGITVLAMARPRTPWRGFKSLIAALEKVKDVRPDINICLFGDYLDKYKIPFEYIDRGVISEQDELAQLYSNSDIFVDASEFQGFGRTALEAMACGTSCVVTNVGGVSEYARNGYNCISVPPNDAECLANAILRLAKDHNMREELRKGGLNTVTKFCHKREAKETLQYFKSLL